MKKWIIFLFASTYILCTNTNMYCQKSDSQIKPLTDSLNSDLAISNDASLFLTVAYYQTKSIYKEGMTKSQFFKSIFKDLPDFKLKQPLSEYFGYIYEYHKKGLNSNEIYKINSTIQYESLVKICQELYSPNRQYTDKEIIAILGVNPKDIDPNKFPWGLVILIILILIL